MADDTNFSPVSSVLKFRLNQPSFAMDENDSRIVTVSNYSGLEIETSDKADLGDYIFELAVRS